MTNNETITIYSTSGAVFAQAKVEEGSRAVASLMQSDYIEVRMTLQTALIFERGYYADVALTSAATRRYMVTEKTFPAYNEGTGGWDYTLKLSAWYYTWNRYILKLNPTYGATSTSFGYTNTFLEHLRVFFACLDAAQDEDSTIILPTEVVIHSLVSQTSGGSTTYHEQKDYYAWNGQTFDHDTTQTVVDETAIDYYSNEAASLVDDSIRYVHYDGAYIIDALNTLCSEGNFGCEWWMDGTVLHFGRCEAGSAVTVENDVDGILSRRDSSNAYATRLIAFGSTTNVPARYRKKLISQITSLEAYSGSSQSSELAISALEQRSIPSASQQAGTQVDVTQSYSIDLGTYEAVNSQVNLQAALSFSWENVIGYEMELVFGDTVVYSKEVDGDETSRSYSVSETMAQTLAVISGKAYAVRLNLVFIMRNDITAYAVFNLGATTLSITDSSSESGYTFADENRIIASRHIGGTGTYKNSIGASQASSNAHYITFGLGTVDRSPYICAPDIEAGEGHVAWNATCRFTNLYGGVSIVLQSIDEKDNVVSSVVLAAVQTSGITIGENVTIQGEANVTMTKGIKRLVIAGGEKYVPAFSATLYYGARSVVSSIVLTDASGNALTDSGGNPITKEVTFNRLYLASNDKRSGWMSTSDVSGISVGTYFMYVDVDEESVPVSFFTDDYADNANVSSFERRLMLPVDRCPYNYIDADSIKDGNGNTIGSEIVEMQKTFETVYPKMDLTVARVEWYKEKVTNTDDDGSTYYTYPVRFAIYIRRSALDFSTRYITSGATLQCQFQSGKLAGYTFDLEFDGTVTTRNSDEPDEVLQKYRIVNSSANGIDLPNTLICPEGDVNVVISNIGNTTSEVGEKTEVDGSGDHLVLLNYNAKSITALGLVAAAEEELYRQAKAYLDKVSGDEGTYTLKLFHDWFDGMTSMPGLGQKMTLVSAGLFATSRTTRVIGYEIPLDIPTDHPIYTIGEAPRYSRLGALEKGSGDGSGIGVGGSVKEGTEGSAGGGTGAGGEEGGGTVVNDSLRWCWGPASVIPTTAAELHQRLENDYFSETIADSDEGVNKTIMMPISWKIFYIAFPAQYTLKTFRRVDVNEDWLQDSDYTHTSTVTGVTVNGATMDFTVVARKVLANVNTSTIWVVFN